MFGYDIGLAHIRTYVQLLIYQLAIYFLHSVINGVKDTAGFRETFLNESKHSGNGSREESVRESTLLVNTPPHTVSSWSIPRPCSVR